MEHRRLGAVGRPPARKLECAGQIEQRQGAGHRPYPDAGPSDRAAHCVLCRLATLGGVAIYHRLDDHSSGVPFSGLSGYAVNSARAVRFALLNAVVIALYTVVDALGARATFQGGGQPIQYVAALCLVHEWPFALYVLARRGPMTVWSCARTRWLMGLGGAAASMGSYGVAAFVNNCRCSRRL